MDMSTTVQERVAEVADSGPPTSRTVMEDSEREEDRTGDAMSSPTSNLGYVKEPQDSWVQNGPAGNGSVDQDARALAGISPTTDESGRLVPRPYPGTVPGSAAEHNGAVVTQNHIRSEMERIQLARELDVRAAFAGLPHVNAQWSHRYMKVMVVGEAGIGKTTFIKNMFAAYAPNPDFQVSDVPNNLARKVFRHAPERLRTQVELRDPERRVVYHYSVQDTPPYGDGYELREQRRDVLAHIAACDDAYAAACADPRRRGAPPPDDRVDACLYFFAPHTLRRVDLDFCAELAAVLPVIPVLAKADAMTTAELVEQRRRVAAALGRAGAAWSFSPDAMAEAGAGGAGPPFAVVAAAEVDLSVGRAWPVRRYPWGRVEALLTRHSDLPALRRLLFEVAFEDLKANTDARFARFLDERERRPGAGPGAVLAGGAASLLRAAHWIAGMAALAWLAKEAAPVLTRDPVARARATQDIRDRARRLAAALPKWAPHVEQQPPPPPPPPAPKKKKSFWG